LGEGHILLYLFPFINYPMVMILGIILLFIIRRLNFVVFERVLKSQFIYLHFGFFTVRYSESFGNREVSILGCAGADLLQFMYRLSAGLNSCMYWSKIGLEGLRILYSIGNLVDIVFGFLYWNCVILISD